MSLTKQQREVFESLVHWHIATYKHTKHGKYCDTSVVVTDAKLKRDIDNIYKKVKRNISYTDFVDEAITEIHNILANFKPYDGDWKGIITGSNVKARNKLRRYIKQKLLYWAIREFNSSYDTTTTVKDEQGNTKTIHLFVNCNMSSLDKVIIDADNETTVLETVDKSYWESDDDFYMNVFSSWVALNAERILLKSQRDFLKTLKEFGYGADDKKHKELREYAGINPKTIHRKLNRIKDRLLEAWRKDERFIYKTYLQQMLEKRLGLLRTFQDIAESDSNLNGMNGKLSNLIRANADSYVFNKLFDKLDKDDYLEVVFSIQHHTPIISEVLYKIATLVDEEIDRTEVLLAKEAFNNHILAKKEGVVVPDKIKYKYIGKTIYVQVTPQGILIPCEYCY